ncbi:MAG: hypothetical protein EXR72_12690 [Myxococcales bacterium]|nr:hypothetical protein [Myxococcales bacterium]
MIRRSHLPLLVALACVLHRGSARAQDPPPAAPAPVAAAAPEPATDNQPEIALDLDREIDIANIVTSAAKGITTVQEAPSVVTIITADEIRQRGFKTMGDLLATIPGWLNIAVEGNQVNVPMVRGHIQAVLFLRDGVSFFDPVLNIATLSRAVPMELIKRVEVVTGPGGVLWGANSYLGIVNMITKDDSDVGGRGIELSVGYGDGRGDRQDFRAYALFGRAFFKDRLKILLHASFESYLGPEFSGVRFLAATPAPQPAGVGFYALTPGSTNAARSWLLNLDGKVTFGPLSLYGSFPIGELNHALGFSSTLVTGDPGGRNKNTWNFYDRHAILEYKSRFVHDRLGLNAKAYYIQFNRDLHVRLFPDSGALATGLTFQVNGLNIQRFGGTVDADFTGPWTWNRVLIGGEAFNERVAQSRTTFPDPVPENIPLTCPLQADGMTYVPNCPVVFINAAERTVVGLFLADQIRPVSTLTLDGGLRYQQGFGKRGYSPQLLGSAAAVWQFLPDAHVKVNFSQGFRPPVFNNTDGNGAGIQFAGNPNLNVERSESYQGELNARLLRNVRKVRELQLRIDYAYTLLNDFIFIKNSTYTNAGRRGIHSVEALAKLYLNGDHAITLGYTFLRVSTTDLGQLRNVPNHWFTVGAVFNLIKEILDVNLNLNVIGATEDPNRYRSGETNTPDGKPALLSRHTDLTFDQLTPVALLQLGARLRLWKDHITASAQVYNVLNQRYYHPDPFNDQAPTIELQPNQAQGFSFFASVAYRP